MYKLTIVIALILSFSTAKASTDSLLLKLDQTLTKKKAYTQKRLDLINNLKKGLGTAKTITGQYKFRRQSKFCGYTGFTNA